jgi:cytochrome c-type biogenesis protein CcmF
MLNVSGNGMAEDAVPIYIIRDNQPMSIKSYSGKSGLHIRFSNIDPVKEEFSFKVAKDIRKSKNVNVEICTDVPRTDYLILQATIFPGINLFWGGTILMMLGLFLAAYERYIKNRR